MDLSDSSPFHRSHDGDDGDDEDSDGDLAAISNRSSPIVSNLDLPTASLGDSSVGDDALLEEDDDKLTVNRTKIPADHSKLTTPLNENPQGEDGEEEEEEDDDDEDIAFAAEAAANAVEEADAEQERLDQSFLRCRICGQGILDGRPLLRFYPTEPNLILTTAQQQQQQMALASSACSGAGAKATPLPSPLPIVNTFDQDIFLHIFCGKTASILPSVNQPELEILTKAGLKNKHGIGPEVNAALARTRCATIVDLEGNQKNSGSSILSKGGGNNTDMISKSSGVKNINSNPSKHNSKHTQEKQYYLVREFEAHLSSVRASHLIMNHHHHQQQNQANSNFTMEDDLASNRQSLLHLNSLGMVDSTSSDPGTSQSKGSSRKRKARSNSTPAPSNTISTTWKHPRNSNSPMTMTGESSKVDSSNISATIGPLSPMLSYPVPANISMVSSQFYTGCNNTLGVMSSLTGPNKTMSNNNINNHNTNGSFQQYKMPVDFPHLFPSVVIGQGAGSGNEPPNAQQSMQSLVFPSQQTQQLLLHQQRQQQFFFGTNMNPNQAPSGLSPMHQQLQPATMMQSASAPSQLAATTKVSTPEISNTATNTHVSNTNETQSPFQVTSMLSGDNSTTTNSPSSSVNNTSPVLVAAEAKTPKATSGNG